MKNIGIDNKSFMDFMEGLEIDFPQIEEDEKKEEKILYQYCTRSFLSGSDIAKIPNIVQVEKNVITKFITELIFITNVELTDSVKKRFGLRRSYKLL
jgi:hypothetical protein